MEEKKYWRGLEEMNPTAEYQETVSNEFRNELPLADVTDKLLGAATPRRDFLKYLGFSTAAAVIASSCEMPVRKAIPYAIKPEEVTPGVANYYASTYADGGDYCAIVVKVRDGRPIKIEGNDLSSITRGGTSARVQASVLSLYDVQRARFPGTPKADGTVTEASYAAIDKQIMDALAQAGGKTAYLLTGTITSPTVLAAIASFTAKYANVKHVMYDAMSASGLLEANGGKVPAYNFEKADTVVSLGADFLGTWLSPIAYAKQYSRRRKVSAKNPRMSKHYQVESLMTITGASADTRAVARPSEMGRVAVALMDAINGTAATGFSPALNTLITNAAADLKKGNGLVVSGSNDVNVQTVVAAINSAIRASIDGGKSSNARKGNDAAMTQLVADMNNGNVGCLMVHGANPVYTYPDSAKVLSGMKNVPLTISFNDRVDETAANCKFIVPDHHFLESWGDAEPMAGYYSLMQPAIAPLFKTRAFADSLLTWASAGQTYGDLWKGWWMGKLGGQTNFDLALQDGVIEPGGINRDMANNGGMGTHGAMAVAHGAGAGDTITVLDQNGQHGEQTPVTGSTVQGSQSGNQNPVGGSDGHQDGNHAGGHTTPGVGNQASGVQTETAPSPNSPFTAVAPGSAAAMDAIRNAPKVSDAEVVVYEKVSIGHGGCWSNNPWLQELPDPITKATWDNYATISFNMAQKLDEGKGQGYEVTSINEVDNAKKQITITVGGKKMTLPAVVVPGQHDDVVGIAVGYGRSKGIGRAAYDYKGEKTYGTNAYPFKSMAGNNIVCHSAAKVEKADGTYEVAITQTHASYEGRNIIREFTLAAFASNPGGLLKQREEEIGHYAQLPWLSHDSAEGHDGTSAHGADAGAHTDPGHQGHGQAADSTSTTALNASSDGKQGANSDLEQGFRENGTMYPNYIEPGNHWGMSIDLNSCIGCGACVIGCQAENNISVVGKSEVLKSQEMHWITIDRYFSGDPKKPDSIQTVFQPMMCQHCDNAPCENVCPVSATNHSSEGLNQMAYNRCIGTKYCANNCPYKVRHFNWFDWNGADCFDDNLYEDYRRDDINDNLTRMVLNPDVTVRSRGVMEKCTFCVQRLQEGKLNAKKEGRPIKDGEIRTACQQACPTDAILFGNVNDAHSAIHYTRAEEQKERTYYVLESTHTLPNVNYLSKVRNTASIMGGNEDTDILWKEHI